jgi:hypothetical protein
VRPTEEILRAHNLLFEAMYLTGLDLPDETHAVVSCLSWVLGAAPTFPILTEVEQALEAARIPKATVAPTNGTAEAEPA